ncbi:MAG TPA: AMP-binding protein [Paracoccus solventivorans]|uniref:AMP-binding protein n=1 Tax=Paracoccus solventivorans TaxID=53463 RepID=UPI002C403BB7|nr:AMP-binding protein [Paracoccus solventivorans]HMM07507.1 AMP-binding protein [Paracoccus solventivorans]
MEPRDDGFPVNGLSWVRGSRSEPLLEITIPELLADCVARRATATAAVFPDTEARWTWDEFSRRVDDLAAGLLRLGFSRGDRLGIWSPNRPEWLLTQFATARIGIILVTINPAYRLNELEYALDLSGCSGLVFAERFKSSDYMGMVASLWSGPDGQDVPQRLPLLRHLIVMGGAPRPGMRSFAEVEALGRGVPRARLDAASAGLDRHDPINIQFTSGTTGRPKGATLTHHNIVNNAARVTSAIRLGPEGRLCIPVPFYHCFGMVMGTLGCVTKGATMIIPGEGFDPAATLAAVAAERATAVYGVPSMFVAMLDSPGFAGHDLSSLRTGIMAGAPCPIEVMKRVQSRMHMAEVTIAYGMTETSPVSFQSATDTPLEKRVSSVGRVHPHVEVRVIGPDGRTVPTGEQGEILTRGYSVMCGYWQDPEQTAAAIDADGWMHTGDLGRIDAGGYCNITGRVKDMICRGGENIYPREIEEFLYSHPAVSQVQVFGLPDPAMGEIVCAWVIPKPGMQPTEEELRAFCKDRIAHYKIPAVIRLRDELPATVTGKPQKFLMRAAMIEELGLVEAENA